MPRNGRARASLGAAAKRSVVCRGNPWLHAGAQSKDAPETRPTLTSPIPTLQGAP